MKPFSYLCSTNLFIFILLLLSLISTGCSDGNANAESEPREVETVTVEVMVTESPSSVEDTGIVEVPFEFRIAWKHNLPIIIGPIDSARGILVLSGDDTRLPHLLPGMMLKINVPADLLQGPVLRTNNLVKPDELYVHKGDFQLYEPDSTR